MDADSISSVALEIARSVANETKEVPTDFAESLAWIRLASKPTQTLSTSLELNQFRLDCSSRTLRFFFDTLELCFFRKTLRCYRIYRASRNLAIKEPRRPAIDLRKMSFSFSRCSSYGSSNFTLSRSGSLPRLLPILTLIADPRSYR